MPPFQGNKTCALHSDQVNYRLIFMETGVKHDDERLRLPSAIIQVKTDDGIEMVNPTSSKQHYKNENCQGTSQSFDGRDIVEAGMIINGDATSGSGESWKGDEIKMCRICHLGKLENSNTEIFIQLGCGCKSELGASHLSCAQTWFKLKGNRLCEICGKIAQNVSGVEETNINANNTNLILAVEWDDMGRFRNTTGITATTRGTSIIQDRERCHRNCRNVVLACLVLAFIIPWLFRVNLF